MKRLILNILSLAIAAVQAAACAAAILLLWISGSDSQSIPPILAYAITALALVLNFFLTKLDSHVRGFAYDGKLIFWISFAVGALRVFVLPFIIVGIIVSFFLGKKDFANLDYSPLYPISCLVFAVSSLDYMTAGDKVKLHQRLEANQLRRKQRAEESRQRREAERERRKNLPHDTDRRGFCSTTFLPVGYRTISRGGRKGMRINYCRSSIDWGTPTVKISVSAPFDIDDVKKSSCSDYSSYRDWIVHSARQWVTQEFERNYCNYTNHYNSCVPIEDVRLVIEVST